MTERQMLEALAKRIAQHAISGLPGTGPNGENVLNFTVTLPERQAIIDALRTARPAADREEVARIIDPVAFRYLCRIGDEDAAYDDERDRQLAYKKADAILSLRATTAGGDGPTEGEPSFVLLGRDPQAPAIIEQWASDRARYEPESDKPARARQIAADMRAFKASNPELGMATPNVCGPSVTTPTGEADAVGYCQPMDCGKHTPRKFMIYFDDPDHGIMVFDNETEARAAFERKNTAWNCYLFGTLPLTAAPGAVAEPVAWRYRHVLGGRWFFMERMPTPIRDGVDITEPLYTHPAPASDRAIREALEQIARFDALGLHDGDIVKARHFERDVQIARAALAPQSPATGKKEG